MACTFGCSTCYPEESSKAYNPGTISYQTWVQHLVSAEHGRNSWEKFGRRLRGPLAQDDQRYVIAGLPKFLSRDDLLELACWMCGFGALTDFLYLRKYGTIAVVLEVVGIARGRRGSAIRGNRARNFEDITEYKGTPIKVYWKKHMNAYEWDLVYSGQFQRKLDAKSEADKIEKNKEVEQCDVKPQRKDSVANRHEKQQSRMTTAAPFRPKDLFQDNFNNVDTTNGRLDNKGKENILSEESTSEEAKIVSNGQHQQQSPKEKSISSEQEDVRTDTQDNASSVPSSPIKPDFDDMPVSKGHQASRKREIRVVLPMSRAAEPSEENTDVSVCSTACAIGGSGNQDKLDDLPPKVEAVPEEGEESQDANADEPIITEEASEVQLLPIATLPILQVTPCDSSDDDANSDVDSASQLDTQDKQEEESDTETGSEMVTKNSTVVETEINCIESMTTDPTENGYSTPPDENQEEAEPEPDYMKYALYWYCY